MYSPVIKQAWIVSSILLNMLGQGMLLGYMSGLLLDLQAPGSTLAVSLEKSSWLVASLGIANGFGFFIASVFMDVFGRRITHGIVLVPAVVGLLLTYNAANFTSLICGRILTGISGGAITLGAVVIGEYCSPEYRGMFLNMKTAGMYLGSLIVHVLSYHWHWRTVALISVTPFAVALAITFTWPESPSWLAQRRRFKESEETFYSLRGTNENSVREIEEMIQIQRATEICKSTIQEKVVRFLKKFTQKNFLKPVMIFAFAAILLETSGRHVFPSYATQIISKITGSTSHTFYYTLAVDVIITVSALFSSYLVKIMKIRQILFSTGSAACVLLALACFYLYLVSIELIPKDYYVIPMTLFGFYFVLANLGCTPVPLVLMGEIFPLEHRAVGGSVAGYLISIFLTITLKIMPYMLHALDIYGAFAVLGACMAVSLVILYFVLPETKNRTLQEIEDFFNYGQYREQKDKGKEEAGSRMIS